MSTISEHRINYALPFIHPHFEEIRCTHCIRENNEVINFYRKSNDGLMILVKFKIPNELPECMLDLEIVDLENENWKENDEDLI